MVKYSISISRDLVGSFWHITTNYQAVVCDVVSHDNHKIVFILMIDPNDMLEMSLRLPMQVKEYNDEENVLHKN